MYKKLYIKIALILATAAILTVPSSMLQVSHAQSNAEFQKSMLDVHNQERAAVGVQPLVWNDELAAGAKAWAEQVATTGDMVHSDYGENIAGFNEFGGGVSSWVNEKNGYTVAPFQFDRDEAHGHYTLMVWQDTREVGCATAPPGAGGLDYSILVCRYSPSGNMEGELPYGHGAAPGLRLGEEDTGAPPAEQTVDDGSAGARLAGQDVANEDAGAPPADQATGGEDDGGGGDDGGDGN
jgi:pathogenesis-related protein 1